MKAHPNAALGYSRLAAVQAAQGDTAAAVATLRSGVEATDHNASLALELANRLEAAGQYEQAAAVYEDMLKRNPASDAAANNLAALYANHRADDPQSLTRALELGQALSKAPSSRCSSTPLAGSSTAGQLRRGSAVLEKAAAKAKPFRSSTTTSA